MGKELSLAIKRKNEIQATQDLKIADAIHKEIYSTTKHLMIKYVEAGKVLLKIKDSLGHGHFMTWFSQADTKISDRTARNYMAIAERWPEIELEHGSKAYCMSIDAALKCVSGLKGDHKSNGKPKLAGPAKITTPTSGESEPCPHGGEHEYDEEACVRCHDPKPKGVKASQATIEAVADEAEADLGDLEPDEGGAEAEAHRVAVESFAAAEKHLVEAHRLMSRLSQTHPHRYQQSAQDSLDVSYQDLRRWKKEVV